MSCAFEISLSREKYHGTKKHHTREKATGAAFVYEKTLPKIKKISSFSDVHQFGDNCGAEAAREECSNEATGMSGNSDRARANDDKTSCDRADRPRGGRRRSNLTIGVDKRPPKRVDLCVVG